MRFAGRARSLAFGRDPSSLERAALRSRPTRARLHAGPTSEDSLHEHRRPPKFVFLRAAFDRGRLPQEQVCIAGKSVHRLILGEWLVNCELEQIIANAKKTAPECDDVEQANENHGKTYRDSLPQLCLESDIRIGCVRRESASSLHMHYVRAASSSESSVTAVKAGKVIVGKASWYGPGLAGHKTASGERFDPNKPTAAAKQMPLGSHAVVTNLRNGRSVKVRIHDRGPVPRGCKIGFVKKSRTRDRHGRAKAPHQ